MAYIYKITNDINDKVYVGKTEFSIEKRFQEHCRDAFKERNEKRPLYSAIKKYGVEHFHIELVEETDNPNEREIYWIEVLEGYTKGYNATLGGDGTKQFDYEQIFTRLKEHPYPSDIAKEFKCSPDLVRQIAKKYNLSVKNKGQELMKENRSKAVSAFTKDGQYVKSFSSTAEGAIWCFETGKSASAASGVRGHIAEVANGKRKTAYGYVWKWD